MSNRGRHKKRFCADKLPDNWIVTAVGKDTAIQLLMRQVDAGNPPNLKVFEKNPYAGKDLGGFDFDDTPEGIFYWGKISRTIEKYKLCNI